MSLKGPYKIMGVVDCATGYALIDEIHIAKGGDGFVHVAIYGNEPVITQPDPVEIESVMVTPPPQLDRGPVIEHFTVSGISFKDAVQDPFKVAYTVVISDIRLKGMQVETTNFSQELADAVTAQAAKLASVAIGPGGLANSLPPS